MLRYRRAAAAADVVHFQWLTVQPLDVHLLPARAPAGADRPRRAAPRAAPRPAARTAAAVRADGRGGRALRARPRAARRRAGHRSRARSTSSLTAPSTTSPGKPTSSRCRPSWPRSEGPVALCFGLMRPYKGIDVLLDAWRAIEGAELWIVGMPRMAIDDLRRAAAGERALRAALHRRPRDPGLLPPRRPGRAALPPDRPVRRAVHGAGLRLPAAAVSGRRLPRGGGHGGGRAGRSRRRHGAARSARATCSPTPPAANAWSLRPRAAAAGPYSWDTSAQDTLEVYRRLGVEL